MRARPCQIVLVLLLSCCVRSAAGFLPAPGSYCVQNSEELARLVGRSTFVERVGGTELRREFIEEGADGGCCVRTWIHTDAGIVDDHGSLLLAEGAVVGSRWRATRGAPRFCELWREVVRAGVDWLEVEDRMYCGGTAETRFVVKSSWMLERGRVSDIYESEGRVTRRRLSTGFNGAGPSEDGGTPCQ